MDLLRCSRTAEDFQGVPACDGVLARLGFLPFGAASCPDVTTRSDEDAAVLSCISLVGGGVPGGLGGPGDFEAPRGVLGVSAVTGTGVPTVFAI